MRLILAFAVALVATIPASASQKSPSAPLDAYKAYLAVLADASSLDQLIPFYTSELGGLLKKMPKDQQANYLKMNKRVLKDLKVTKQAVTDARAELDMTATMADGRPTSGRAILHKEDGAWKIDEDAWATGLAGGGGLTP